jgi:hypothetical protein
MSDDESTAYHRISPGPQDNHACVMTEMIMEIRDKVNYMVQEQKYIKADVREMKDERKSVIFGILAFVGLTVGGAVIWAIKNGAHSA